LRRNRAIVGLLVGLAMTLLFLTLFAVRIRIEGRTLLAGLLGYADYTRRAR
jgi:protein-S-isoprenylcysteine O-methyltransferase Ste14